MEEPQLSVLLLLISTSEQERRERARGNENVIQINQTSAKELDYTLDLYKCAWHSFMTSSRQEVGLLTRMIRHEACVEYTSFFLSISFSSSFLRSPFPRAVYSSLDDDDVYTSCRCTLLEICEQCKQDYAVRGAVEAMFLRRHYISAAFSSNLKWKNLLNRNRSV